MKKFFTLLMLACGMTVSAQNIQLHYDFGRNIYTGEEAGRQKVTITLEQFKADQWGQWYYFVDFDLSRHFVESAYTEISREINLGKESPFSAHVEYDGGLSRSASFQQAGLIGAAYNGHTADFSKTWSVGFIDFWRGEKANGHGCLVILSEPQLWYNFTEHFSVGTEWEFSNNFVYNSDPESSKTFFWNPTLAVKWNF